jgi:hypothetical protein
MSIEVIKGVKISEMAYRFCREWLIDFDQTQAAIRAGYSKKTAGCKAAQLMMDPKVRKTIDRLREEDAKHFRITRENVIEQLAMCAMRNGKDLFCKNGVMILNHVLLREHGVFVSKGLTVHDLPDAITQSIDGVKQKCNYTERDGTEYIEVQTELKLVGKAQSWDMLMKHFGGYAPEKHEVLTAEVQVPTDFWGPGRDDEIPDQLEADP